MSTRKSFLAAGTALAIAPALAGAAETAKPPSPTATNPPLNFDLAAFHAALTTTAKHKHAFASVKIDGAEVMGAMRNTLHAYADIGVAHNDVFPIAVLYHGVAITLAFDDTIWESYTLPFFHQSPKDSDVTKDLASVIDAKTAGNPLREPQGGEWDRSITSLVSDAGARFFVCNNAARGYARTLANALKRDPDSVYDELARHLVPNAMLVPAGVWAVHAIQERGFTLLQTSV